MKVLVVEDEWLVRELIVGELLDAGFDVVEAESGEAALARYHEHNPDVLFTDIRLPGQIDGWDVAERCRASNSDLPVVYATGYSPTEHRLVPGPVLISKPYTCARVIGVIKRVMSRSSAAPRIESIAPTLRKSRRFLSIVKLVLRRRPSTLATSRFSLGVEQRR